MLEETVVDVVVLISDAKAAVDDDAAEDARAPSSPAMRRPSIAAAAFVAYLITAAAAAFVAYLITAAAFFFLFFSFFFFKLTDLSVAARADKRSDSACGPIAFYS